jgi:hypothetical protein
MSTFKRRRAKNTRDTESKTANHGSGSFQHQEKKVRKNFISFFAVFFTSIIEHKVKKNPDFDCFVTFLSKKTDVNVPSKSKKKKSH